MAENDDHEIPNSLQPLAAALTKAGTVEGVADALVREGLPALNACVAVLALLNDEGTEFFCPCITGYPEKVTDVWRHFPADAPVPIGVAVRSGRPILLKSLEERIAFYPPDMALPDRVGRALAAIPIKQDGVVGGLGFTFPDDRAFRDDEQAALIAATGLCAKALSKARRRGLGCEVLIVEEEPAVMRMLDFVLRFHAFTVRKAAGGQTAIAAFEQHRSTVNVVLIDMQMPEMDGLQTLAALLAIDPEVRCVLMSGSVGKYSVEEIQASGAAQALAKPFRSLDEVMRVLLEIGRRTVSS